MVLGGENERLFVKIVKNLLVLIALVAVVSCTSGCMTYQRNAVVKKNHIVTTNADGSKTEDFSTVEDNSKGFAAAGSAPATANRRYMNQSPVGTEGLLPIGYVPVRRTITRPAGQSQYDYGYQGTSTVDPNWGIGNRYGY